MKWHAPFSVVVGNRQRCSGPSATFHGRIYFMRRQMQSRGRRTSTDYPDYTDYLLESEVECLSYSVFIRNSNGQHGYLKIICVICVICGCPFSAFGEGKAKGGRGCCREFDLAKVLVVQGHWIPNTTPVKFCLAISVYLPR